jgi:hypothetical protein
VIALTDILDLLRHPLVLLVIATTLSALVVPKISYRLKLQEVRLKKALDLIDHSTEVNRRLNALLTTLELFHKDNSGVAARLSDYRQEQRELRKAMMSRYLEFDNVAWWWYGNALTEALLFGLTSAKRLQRMRSIINAYELNLLETTDILNALWSQFLREEYDPTDLQNTEALNNTRGRLAESEQSRNNLIAELGEILAGKKISRLEAV